MWATATLKKENVGNLSQKSQTLVSLNSKHLQIHLIYQNSKQLELVITCQTVTIDIHGSRIFQVHHFHPFEDALIRHAAFIAV